MTFPVKTITFVLLFVALIASFTWYADPYDFWKSGFIKYKNYEAPGLRIYHPVRIAESDFDYILIGSSRTRHTYIPQLYDRNVNAYNAGFDGASAYELGRLMSVIAQHSKPKTVIYGIDFFTFAPNLRVQDPSRHSPIGGRPVFLTKLSSLVSYKAIKTSLDNIKLHQENKITHPPQFFTWKPFDEPRRRFETLITSHAGNYLGRFNPDDTSVDPVIIDTLKKGTNALTSNGIKVIFIINPLHAAHMRLIEEIGLSKHYDAVMNAIIKLAQNIETKNSSMVEVWDFSVCASIAKEPVPASNDLEMKYFYDSSHPTPAFGSIIWDQVISKKHLNQSRKLYQGTNVSLSSSQPFQRNWSTCTSNFDDYVPKAIKEQAAQRCKTNYLWCDN